MSDFPRHWLPKSTRNRWALALAVCSLLLLITWNLMPKYNTFYPRITPQQDGIMASRIWPSVFVHIMTALEDVMDLDSTLTLIVTFSLLLLVMVNLLLVPFWSVPAKSKVLRYIPAVICLLGFAAMVYFLAKVIPTSDDNDLEKYDFIWWSLIGLNFLLMAISLLLFGQEPAQDVELDVPIS